MTVLFSDGQKWLGSNFLILLFFFLHLIAILLYSTTHVIHIFILFDFLILDSSSRTIKELSSVTVDVDFSEAEFLFIFCISWSTFSRRICTREIWNELSKGYS